MPTDEKKMKARMEALMRTRVGIATQEDAKLLSSLRSDKNRSAPRPERIRPAVHRGSTMSPRNSAFHELLE